MAGTAQSTSEGAHRLASLPKANQHSAMATMLVGRNTKRLLELENVEILRQAWLDYRLQEEILLNGMDSSHSGWYEVDQLATQSEEQYAQALADIPFCLEKREYIRFNQVKHFRVTVVSDNNAKTTIHLNFCGEPQSVLGDTNASLKSKALRYFGISFSHKEDKKWTMTERTGRINIRCDLGSQLARLGAESEDITFDLVLAAPFSFQ